MIPPAAQYEASSLRTDHEARITERVQFVGQANSELYTVLSMPIGRVLGGVVIASSLLTDLLRSYRGEVLMGRRLASLGYAVLRFDYRGFGHSDGETGVTNVGFLADDLAAAITILETHIGPAPMTLVGSRFGSLLVANHPAPAARRVFWDPVLTGHDYFRTAFRAHMVGTMRSANLGSTPSAQLRDNGRAGVLGYTVGRDLVESTRSLSLVSKGLAGCSVLWVDTAVTMSKPGAQSQDDLRSMGVDLAIRHMPVRDPGWFVGVRPREDRGAITAIAEWLSSRTSS